VYCEAAGTRAKHGIACLKWIALGMALLIIFVIVALAESAP
jgi:hypothetical protein